MAHLNHIPWWQWLPIPWWRIVATVDAADEVPSRLPRKGAILVGTRNKPKWLAFDCPCRVRHRVMVTLDRTRRPHWTVHGDRFFLSLSPSVNDRTLGRRCHYFIRRGSTIWARDNEALR